MPNSEHGRILRDRYLNVWVPEADVHQREVLSGLGPRNFAAWRALRNAGNLGLCRGCLDEVVPGGVSIGNGSRVIQDLREHGLEIQKGAERCGKHPTVRSWDILPSPGLPHLGSSLRAEYGTADRKKIKAALPRRCAFTHQTNALEVDHREPPARTDTDEVPLEDLDDIAAINARYMHLTRQANIYKRQKCKKCKETGERGTFYSMPPVYPIGGARYQSEIGCKGCPLAYPEKYRDWLEELAVQEVALKHPTCKRVAPGHSAAVAALSEVSGERKAMFPVRIVRCEQDGWFTVVDSATGMEDSFWNHGVPAFLRTPETLTVFRIGDTADFLVGNLESNQLFILSGDVGGPSDCED